MHKKLALLNPVSIIIHLIFAEIYRTKKVTRVRNGSPFARKHWLRLRKVA
jgi:hypothetical protein